MTAGFLLDTNIPSELIRQQPEAYVERWLSLQREESLFLSVITLGELRKGANLLVRGKRRLALERWLEENLIPRFADRTLPVTQAIAERWGVLTAERQPLGAPLAVADGLIAATAREHNLTLVTRNVRHMAGLGVELLNPWELSL